MLPSFVILALVFLSTLFALVFIYRERNSFTKRAVRHVSARQSSHSTPTPRVGGIAIAVGILSGALLSGDDIFGLMLWTTLPIFLIGLVEDLGPDTPPSLRLSVAALSAVLAIMVLGVKIERVDVGWFDTWLAIGAVGIAFTIFASAGMTHALNLMDGLNGLSSATVILIMIGFGATSYKFDHSDLVVMNAVIIVAFLGFMLMNFPRGRIFLGDAGAYSVGHVIAWNAIILLNREPSISAWGILLIVLWPVLDTLSSIWRRVVSGRSPALPDRLHFHHLLMRLVKIISIRNIPTERANPIGSILMWPFIAAPCVIGYIFIDSPSSAMWSTLLFFFVYAISYTALVKFAGKLRKLL